MRQAWWWLGLFVLICVLIYLLDSMLMPFVAGTILAYLVNPLANRFQQWGLNRPLAVCAVFLVLILGIAAAFLMLLPPVIGQAKQLGALIPSVFDWFENVLAPQVQSWTGYDPASELDNIQAVLLENWRDAGGYAAQALGQIGRSGMAFVTWITYVGLIPVIIFYLLLDWNRLVINLSSLVPRHWRDDVFRITQRCDEVLASFIRGQLLVMVALGAIYALGLTLMGLNFGLLIGFIAGLASIVPFLGFIVGICVALVVALFQYGSWLAILGVVVVFAIGQTVESVVLQPKLLGDKIGLHPVAVIFAVLAGGQLFGFVGVLLALPAAAVLMVLLRELNERYKHSALFDADYAAPQERPLDTSVPAAPHANAVQDAARNDQVRHQRRESP
ncbi:AI-2E family transporter [Halomonas dongshanensis]|uniref:AI-2E family transporter n=1 Tax=Halomonas dongshanensis TaxID=2890835 RepID=A0ABT2EF04_9GAMM|nr:AI-2E family transporter [Halomonas dongshanensis]MCS2610169.1 AI-2E family transporter [Halomonas dongshanensis]